MYSYSEFGHEEIFGHEDTFRHEDILGHMDIVAKKFTLDEQLTYSSVRPRELKLITWSKTTQKGTFE